MKPFSALILCATVCFNLAACSHAAFYESMRLKQQNFSDSQQLPKDSNSFKAQALPSYETYKRELKKFDPEFN